MANPQSRQYSGGAEIAENWAFILDRRTFGVTYAVIWKTLRQEGKTTLSYKHFYARCLAKGKQHGPQANAPAIPPAVTPPAVVAMEARAGPAQAPIERPPKEQPGGMRVIVPKGANTSAHDDGRDVAASKKRHL